MLSLRSHRSWKVVRICRKHSSWSSKLVRSSFITYFENEHKHQHVQSSSVIPSKGQGTYFTNAGMNQFKPVFLDTVKPGSRLAGYTRVVNSQKCIRVGGKHNDLEDVGRDLTHHTFFEMLGSWSFGDYFKRKACNMAIRLLTEVYGLSMDRLYFTYFGGNEELGLEPDLECRDIWLAAGVPAHRLLPFGMRDNFWDMGETGPCGPCTEIHFDHVGGRDAAPLVNMDSPDVVEIWNLVFMQFNRKHGNVLEPLPRQHVDTGMGFERMVAVLQGSRSNYDTDLFQPLFTRLSRTTGAPSYGGKTGDSDPHGLDQAYRIIADHTRMISVAVADGLLPGRYNLQHKLRSIINRAIHQLDVVFGVEAGKGGQLLGDLSQEVVESLGETYPELEKNSEKIKEVLRLAAEQYKQLSSKVKDTKNQSANQQNHQEDKKEKDGYYRRSFTIGDRVLPIELFLPRISDLHNDGEPVTDDIYKYTVYSRSQAGYDFTKTKDVAGSVLRFLVDDELCGEMKEGKTGAIILDKTCFYSQSGGQAADTGHLHTQCGVFEVLDVQDYSGYVLHIGRVTEGKMSRGEKVAFRLDQTARVGCMCNHTGTHLLNSALRSVLGDTTQMGSDVQTNKFTFDFASLGSLSLSQLETVENIVRQQILAGHRVTVQEMDLDSALQLDGLTLLDNEEYPSPVRVISIGEELSPFKSVELCGGTHVVNTADLEAFCVVKLTGVAQGTKRITCVTGQDAVKAIEAGEILEERLTALVQDVESGNNLDTWGQQVKDINKMLKELTLPKVIRDKVKDKLDRIGETIKAAQNKQLQSVLQQEVLEFLEGNAANIGVKKMTFDGKQMQKALTRVELSKPVVLVSEGERSSIAVIAAPSHQVEVVERLASECKGPLSEYSVRDTPAQCGEDKTVVVVTVKGRRTGDQLYSVLSHLAHS